MRTLSLIICLSLCHHANAQVSSDERSHSSSHRINLLSGEASLQTHSLPHFSIIKPEGEQFETVNFIEQRLTFHGQAGLPSSGEVHLDFVSQIDGLDRIPVYMFGANPSELSFEFSRDGQNWGAASVRAFVDGTFRIIFSESLNTGERASIRCRLPVLDFSEEEAPQCVEDRPFAHVLSPRYLMFNAESTLFDSYTLTTVITTDGSISPGGLGRVISRPAQGEPGDWVYQSEIDSYLTVYAVGAQYPQAMGELIEIFDPPNQLGRFDHAHIINSIEEGIAVYEELYGPFPYSRLGVYPISEQANAAIGPQAQILLPWYFWDDRFEISDLTFEPKSVTYHELAHQYFFNMVRLNPDPSLGQAWLSEAMAEFSAIRAIEETSGDARLHRWINHLVYLLMVQEGDEAPIASAEVIEHPNYFPSTYLRGSTLIYGIYHRMSDFTEKLRECVISWRGLFIEARDMYACFSSMSPKAAYASFSIEEYITRYFTGITRDLINVDARWVDDDQSVLLINDESWSDSLELRVSSAQGEISSLYPQRAEEMNVPITGASVLIDPEISTPRFVVNQYPVDVDLNGVIDGQDALDVLYHVGVTFDSSEIAFPVHLDIDGDLGISTLDLREIQREMGRIRE